MPDTVYDIIIIGTGAGGGTLAHAHAPSGKRILLLERGDWLSREKDNWDTEKVFIDGKYKARESWHDRDGKPFEPGIHCWVGKSSKVHGAALLRFRRQDFRELTHGDTGCGVGASHQTGRTGLVAKLLQPPAN